MGDHLSCPLFSLIRAKLLIPLRLAGDSFQPIFEGLPAKRAYIAFLADFHFFLQDQANFWQTDLC